MNAMLNPKLLIQRLKETQCITDVHGVSHNDHNSNTDFYKGISYVRYNSLMVLSPDTKPNKDTL